MPFSENWPFKRVMVDHMFHGITRIWWEHFPTFSDASPITYQLQAGYTGSNSALDWINIGDAAQDAWYLEDDGNDRDPAGKLLLTHYRVVASSAAKTYVSEPAPIWGVLEKKDWLLAQEIVRKERLRLGMTGMQVYLLKRFRHGSLNTPALDTLTDEIIDSRHPGSFGTQFKVGYHPPVLLTIDASNWVHEERRGGDNPAAHSSLQVSINPRMIAAPFIHTEDILVDAHTDQRWSVDKVAILSNWRGIPLIVQPTLNLLPHNNVVYKIPVGRESYDLNDLVADPLPDSGKGCIKVNHDYPTNNNLTYQTGNCCGIAGATILAFTKVDWDNSLRTSQHAKATAQTGANGWWVWDMKLDPGDYVLVFEKSGEYGPDIVELLVRDTGPPPPLSSLLDSSISSSTSSDFGSF